MDEIYLNKTNKIRNIVYWLILGLFFLIIQFIPGLKLFAGEDSTIIREALEKETLLIGEKAELDSLEIILVHDCNFNTATYDNIKQKDKLNQIEKQCYDLFISIVEKKKKIYEYSIDIGKSKSIEKDIPFLGFSFLSYLYPIISKLIVVYLFFQLYFSINEIQRIFDSDIEINILKKQIYIENSISFPPFHFLLLKSRWVISMIVIVITIMTIFESFNFFCTNTASSQMSINKIWLGCFNIGLLVINLFVAIMILWEIKITKENEYMTTNS